MGVKLMGAGGIVLIAVLVVEVLKMAPQGAVDIVGDQGEFRMPTASASLVDALLSPPPTTVVELRSVAVLTSPPEPSATPREQRPIFSSDVAARGPAEIAAYLTGKHPCYPGSNVRSIFDFSPSNILETMDAAALDKVRNERGAEALARAYILIAHAVVETLAEEYPSEWLVVALDAGHGGKKGFYWDAGAEGTEADHNRAVAQALLAIVEEPAYRRFIVRPIYNDAIADDFGLTAAEAKRPMDRMLMRQTRASMLAAEAMAWNGTHPGSKVAVHEISIHFNSGAGGALVLYQGEQVQNAFIERSFRFGRRYLDRVIAAFNSSAILTTPLRPWQSGLHDDVMLYRPTYLSADETRGRTLRYGTLQADDGFLSGYIALLSELPRLVGDRAECVAS